MDVSVISAGGMIIKRRRKSYYSVIVGNDYPIIWRIPFGMQNENETIEETALREVKEETGLSGKIINLIDQKSWKYSYDNKIYHKTCFFYLIEYLSGQFEERDDEFEHIQWAKMVDIERLLYYDLERNIARQALQFLSLG